MSVTKDRLLFDGKYTRFVYAVKKFKMHINDAPSKNISLHFLRKEKKSHNY